MYLIKFITIFLCCVIVGVNLHAQQNLSTSASFLFKKTPSRLTNAEKNHLFEQLDIKWSANKDQFVDNDDEDELTPYLHVGFFPVDINRDGSEEVFIVLSNEALFETTGVKIIFFAKDEDGSYQKNTEIPVEDLVPLTRKHLGYPDLLLGSSGALFNIWRWDGKRYKFFQRVSGQQLPNGPNQGIEDVSAIYQAAIKKNASNIGRRS
ncbi:MAG: hypothetical protein ABIU63_09340 [Chitinophagaceae bacterium]